MSLPPFGLVSKIWVSGYDFLTSSGKKNQALNDICSLARANMTVLKIIINAAPASDFNTALAEARQMKANPGNLFPSPTRIQLRQPAATTTLDVASKKFDAIKSDQAFVLPANVRDLLSSMISTLDRYHTDYNHSLTTNSPGSFRFSRCLRLHDAMIDLHDSARLSLPERHRKRFGPQTLNRII
ncbi:hypothetical protein ACOMYX_19540 (plasmid) [Pantoea agglomerans]|uniref:hypothetical protein n=1 Tax=Pantoea sp. BRR-3P TaxID=3141541 RepID=UPI0031F518FE